MEKRFWVQYKSEVSGNEKVVSFDTEKKADDFAKENNGTRLDW